MRLPNALFFIIRKKNQYKILNVLRNLKVSFDLKNCFKIFYKKIIEEHCVKIFNFLVKYTHTIATIIFVLKFLMEQYKSTIFMCSKL